MTRRATLFALTLLAAACTGSDSAALDWDLSDSHTVADIGRPDRPGGGGIDDVESVRIKLPDNSVFEAADDIRDIAFLAIDGNLRRLDVAFDNQTAEDTYARALALIDEWELTNHVRLDTWWAQAQGVTGPDAARVDTSEIGASRPGTFDEARIGGPDGPFIQISILYSFNDDKPFFVQFEIYW